MQLLSLNSSVFFSHTNKHTLGSGCLTFRAEPVVCAEPAVSEPEPEPERHAPTGKQWLSAWRGEGGEVKPPNQPAAAPGSLALRNKLVSRSKCLFIARQGLLNRSHLDLGITRWGQRDKRIICAEWH